jgi:hypothetical protein
VDHDSLVGLSFAGVGTSEDDRPRELDDEVAIGLPLVGDRFRPLGERAGGGLRRRERGRGCLPASRWIKADRLHPLLPRETPPWTALYRRRAAVEDEIGRLKNDWALVPSASVGWIVCGCTPI